MTKKQNAIARAESAVKRFRPNSDACPDARAYWASAASYFETLAQTLTTDQIQTLGFILDDLIDSLRADQTARAEQRPSRPTEPPAPSAGTIHIPAPYRWAMGYSAKLDAVENTYHAWQLAMDAQRKYRGTDEAKKTALRARAAELKLMYNAVRSDLYAWVVAHPAPEGAAELI